MLDVWECHNCENVNGPDTGTCLRCGQGRGPTDLATHAVAGLELTDEEWRTLLFAPLWVFSAVAGADGKIDKAELTAFGRVLEKSLYLPDALLRELLGSIARDLRATFDDFAADDRTAEEGLTQVAALLDSKLLAEHASATKRTLFALGDRVARASGAGLLGIGERVGEAEEEALMAVAMHLGLTEPRQPDGSAGQEAPPG